MGIKKFKPVTPGTRFRSTPDFSEITTDKPYKPLTEPNKRKGGRNAHGRITAFQRGGGHKRLYRKIDYKRNKFDIPAKVSSIEYDPNRSSRIALLNYADGFKSYILAPNGLKVGDTVISGDDVEISLGNALAIKKIPVGTIIHNIELKPKGGGKLARAAGSSAQITAKEGDYAQVKLISGEVRLIHLDCMATIGRVGNMEHELVVLGKAGRKRHLGKRPVVRGVAMNPVDHPLGGGEGKSSGGRHPVTPWGVPTKGFKTRDKNKPSNKHIIRRGSKKR